MEHSQTEGLPDVKGSRKADTLVELANKCFKWHPNFVLSNASSYFVDDDEMMSLASSEIHGKDSDPPAIKILGSDNF